MALPEKTDAEVPSSEPTFDAPPAHSPAPQNPPPESTSTASSAKDTETKDDRNPSTLPSTMGPKKVYTTYHLYLSQNYMRKLKVATAKHLNSSSPSHIFTFPDDGPHAGGMEMHAGGGSDSDADKTALLGTASFGKEYGSSKLELADGRVATISVVPRSDRAQKVRLFRIDIQYPPSTSPSPSPPHPHPTTMFWEMGSRNHGASRGGGSLGNLDFMDEERRVYAVLVTGWHKSLKKMGRLHWLVEPGEGQGKEGLVELAMGTLMAVWKKAERDVRRGRLGLGT